MKKLTRTGIEYGDLNWSIYPGCLHKPAGICPVPHCWAEAMSKRQRQNFHLPHLIPELLLAPLSFKKTSVILVNFMGDLFGDWVDPDKVIEGWTAQGFGVLGTATLREAVFNVVSKCPQHRFLFLTKAPWNYKRWGSFPENAWLGATVTNEGSLVAALYNLTEVGAGGRWLSVEPMYAPVVPKTWPAEWDEIGWVVIGGQSNPVKYPHTYWVEDLVMECVKAKKPVWLKENLAESLPPTLPFYVPPRETPAEGPFELVYRQEIPNEFYQGKVT